MLKVINKTWSEIIIVRSSHEDAKKCSIRALALKEVESGAVKGMRTSCRCPYRFSSQGTPIAETHHITTDIHDIICKPLTTLGIQKKKNQG